MKVSFDHSKMAGEIICVTSRTTHQHTGDKDVGLLKSVRWYIILTSNLMASSFTTRSLVFSLRNHGALDCFTFLLVRHLAKPLGTWNRLIGPGRYSIQSILLWLWYIYNCVIQSTGILLISCDTIHNIPRHDLISTRFCRRVIKKTVISYQIHLTTWSSTYRIFWQNFRIWEINVCEWCQNCRIHRRFFLVLSCRCRYTSSSWARSSSPATNGVFTHRHVQNWLNMKSDISKVLCYFTYRTPSGHMT